MWQEIKNTLKLGWPIIVGNVTQMSLGFIDNAMVGRIHSSQIAAASLVNSTLGFPIVFGIGLTLAISVLVAEAYGQDNYERPLMSLFNGLILATSVALMFAVFLSVRSDIVYHLGQDEIVAVLAEPYLKWMAWGMIPMVGFLALKQFMDGLGFTRLPLYVSLLVLPLNVGLNYIFIYGHFGFPRMELEGAGIGTLLSRFIVFIILATIILKHSDFEAFRKNIQKQLRFNLTEMKRVIKIGIPSAMQFGMEVAAFAITGIMAGWLGYIQQSAHQIALSLGAMAFMVALGISSAGTIRLSFHWGQKNKQKSIEIANSTLILATLYGVVMGVVFIVFKDQLPYIFNDEPEVVRWASILLVTAAIFQISDAVQAVAIGLLRGIQDVNFPTGIVFVSYWVIAVPLGYFLAFTFNKGIVGLWIGLIVGLTISAIFNTWRFYHQVKK